MRQEFGDLEDIPEEDFDRIDRLYQQFAADLEALSDDIDSLETRLSEVNTFSNTTKLFGQVVFGVQGRGSNTADFFPVDGIPDTEDPSDQINFISNVQLSLLSQFAPRSLLLLGLQSRARKHGPRA